MNSIQICIPFIVAILGVAFPILFQVISNLGEKYDSVLLVSIFKKEREYVFFNYLLYITLGAVLLYILTGITRIVNVNCLIEQLENLIIILTLFLICSFFCLVRKILKYYNRNDLTSYFIDKDRNIVSDSGNYIYFESLSELLYWSIRNQNEHIAKTISDYFYKCFHEFRKRDTYSETGYPDQYYTVTYKASLEILKLDDNKLIFLENRIPGGIWLLGEFVKNKIPEKTYTYLWINLRQCTDYKRDDIILYYWQNSSQYFSHSLCPIDSVYSADYKNILNETEINQREIERVRFLEFNYALGGLLLYQERYDCIHRLFRFTQTEPPKYVLLPQTMRDVFDLFFKFMDSYSKEMNWIAHKYSFPNTEGIDADGVIRNWIRRYIAILFLRQYTLITYYTYQQHVAVPLLPETQGERKFWLNYIDYFKDLVLDVCSNMELMNGLKFDLYEHISDEWCEMNEKLSPEKLFEETKNSLTESIDKAEREQEPSAAKITQFKDSTNRIVLLLLDNYDKLINPQKIIENYHSWHSRGAQAPIDKNSFVDDQGVTHMNFDSFLAEDYAKELNYSISQQFYFKKTKSYLLDKEKLFRGVDYLKIKNPDEYIIIAFDLYIPYFKGTKGLDVENSKYKGIEICKIDGSFNFLNQSLVVMKKTDLPCFNYLEINPEIKEKYELEEINSQIKLYASVIDLNKRRDLSKEVLSVKEVDPRTQVLLRINLSAEFRWKNNVDLIQIKLVSIYEEKGIPNKLKDIKPINNKKDEKNI